VRFVLLVARVVDELGVRVCSVYKYPCTLVWKNREKKGVRAPEKLLPSLSVSSSTSSLKERERAAAFVFGGADSACVAEASPNNHVLDFS
jgi:hypothetical protein